MIRRKTKARQRVGRIKLAKKLAAISDDQKSEYGYPIRRGSVLLDGQFGFGRALLHPCNNEVN